MAAIDAALRTEPPREIWNISELAALVAPKHLAVSPAVVERYIRHGMTDAQRKDRNIKAPRVVAKTHSEY